MRKGGKGMSTFWPMALFGFLGVMFVLAAFGTYRSYVHEHEVCTGYVRGTVVDLVKHVTSSHDHKSGTTYAPVVQFYVNGIEYKVQSNSSSYPPEYNVGDLVDVHYNPDNPKETYFDKDSTSVVLGVVFGSFGVAMCFIPIMLFVLSKRGVI